MGRVCFAIALLLGSLVFPSCGGGGGSSPTAPTPRSLAGTSRGEISGTAGGGAVTCPLVLELEQDEEDEGFYFGSWDADCPGAEVAGLAVAFDLAGFTLLSAFSTLPGAAAHPLGTCGWAAEVTLRGDELSGTWDPPQDCEDPSLAGGPLRVGFVG
jgi:hypothetical protein